RGPAAGHWARGCATWPSRTSSASSTRSRGRARTSRSMPSRRACARASSPSGIGTSAACARSSPAAFGAARCARPTRPSRPVRFSARSTGPRTGSAPRVRSHRSGSPSWSPTTPSAACSSAIRSPQPAIRETPMPNAHIALTVNGDATEVAFAPYKTLLEVLREDLNLCGTKHGCELGEFGACAVLLDGQPVLSCLVLADDLMLPRTVHCKLLRSTIPHARIVGLDVSRALAHPGVLLALTGRDFPIAYGILPVSQDEHALAVDRVRFVGDPVAAVIARDE